MHEYLIEMLVCPACHGPLGWQIDEQQGERIEQAVVTCRKCSARYEVRDGIGFFLTPDLQRHDLWDEVESGLAVYLRDHPDIERQLLGTPLEELAPADRFFRAMALEEKGDFDGAAAAAREAQQGLYTTDYLAASEKLVSGAIERLESGSGPVVDLASGRGHLAERILRQVNRPLVITDFSPRILRRNRRWFSHFGLYERVSLLAFDARRTPFAGGAVGTMTTYHGLANIERPGELLVELRRVVSGSFLACTLFYPEEDEANRAVIREIGLEEMLYEGRTLAHFQDAGWRVSLATQIQARALPTPKSELLGGAGIDGLPVAPTELTWCLLDAR